MLSQNPKGISSRFSCHPSNFSAIADALNNIGHVVIENVFDQQTLIQCDQYAQNLFCGMDERYLQGDFCESELINYLGNTYSFIPDKIGSLHLELFLTMIETSGMLDLYAHLLKGDVAAFGPVLRRADPAVAIRKTGLHTDGQVTEYALKATHSNSEYTLWIPFCAINEKTPALLLMARGLQFSDNTIAKPGYHQGPTNNVFIYDKRKGATSEQKEGLDVTPLYLHNRPMSRPSEGEILRVSQRHDAVLNGLISRWENDIHVPHMDLGSAIIFDRDIIHCSFSHDGMSQARHSADIRFVGSFDTTHDFINKERAYIYKKFMRQHYDPFASSSKPMIVNVETLQKRINELEQQLVLQRAESRNKWIRAQLRNVKVLRWLKDKVRQL